MNFQDNKMHKDDKKNMVIFFIACLALFFLYDRFIYAPKMEQIKETQEQMEMVAQNAPSINNSAPSIQTSNEILTETKSNRVQIQSDTLNGSLNLQGLRIDDLELKKYHTEPQGDEDVRLLSPFGGLQAYYSEFGWLASDSAIKLPNKSTQWRTNNTKLTPENPLMLNWSNGQGLIFNNKITLDDQYMFGIEQSVTNNTGRDITLYPFALIGRDGMPLDMTNAFILHEGPIGYITDELYEADYEDLDEGTTTEVRGNRGWIGITDKYWLTAIMPGKDDTGENKFRFTGEPLTRDVTRYQSDMMGAAITIAAGQSASVPMEFFAGPKIVDMLEAYATQYDVPHFDLAVDFGILYFLTRPFYEVLTFLNGLFGNFAIALLVFTVLIKACVFPLAQKSYRSFARMRKVAPQMVEIRDKYKDDRTKLQAALFDLYKKEQVNPMAGCFPILIQIPIFFSLYKVFYVNIGMRHEPFWGWINDMSSKDPTNMFEFFGLIPWDTPSFLHIGLWPIIMGFTLWLQQRLSPPPTDPTQKFVMGIMPFWLTIILGSFPAGLVIYWSWSNLLSVLQQYVLLRQEGVSVNIFTRSRSEEKLEDMIGGQSNNTDDIIEHEPKKDDTPKTVTPKKRKRKK
jgi:YidC/Oxa1 family membrane protein insertase